MTDQPERFAWSRHPDAADYIAGRVDVVVESIPPVGELAAALLEHTGSHLSDWLDHVVVADGDAERGRLADLGFEPEGVEAEAGHEVWHHPGTILPRTVLRAGSGEPAGEVLALAIQVEDVPAFLLTHRLSTPVEGSPLGGYRRARAWQIEGSELLVVERRGHGGFVPASRESGYVQQVVAAYERWATRPRLFPEDREGMAYTLDLARSLVGDLGIDAAAWVAFAAERAYWGSRNRAGMVQKARHDRLGLGWADHDHHTFRSSRRAFRTLIQILETFGFHSRERFYAGAEAGWGAQVMEQPVCRLAVFADVDLSPAEVSGDFAHQPLEPRDELGTVGLWCALHGESMLGAGLHHLAARYDFDVVTEELASWDVRMMRPFSDFPYLRQAFTAGERWPVARERLEPLFLAGQIGESQHGQFAEKGAIGSHLENIQRREGFKGFNQHTISDIIHRTDPRAN